MAQSGGTQLVDIARTRWRERLRDSAAYWRAGAEIVWGPLLTLAALIIMDQFARQGTPVLHPFTVLLLTIVISGFIGGFRTALISAVLTVLYAVHYFAEPGLPLSYRPSGAYSLLVIGIVAPGVAVLVSRLREDADRGRAAALDRDEAEALDRRVSFLSQASRTLASSMDYEVTFRELSRITVPALADWCAIHAVDARGKPHFLAGAHRDPARDLYVRALCEFDDSRVPFDGPANSALHPVEVTESRIRLLASGEDHRKLYRALTATWTLQAPLLAEGRLAGVITLGMTSETGRRFHELDVRYVNELSGRAALAMGAGQLYREAQEADRRYRLLFEANPQPMWAFDVASLEFLAVNDAAVRFYGYSRDELLAMTIMDIRPAEEPPGLPFAGEAGRRGESALTRHQRRDGTVVDVELISHELDLDGRRARLVLATDISDRSRTRAALQESQEQLRQAQRLLAVGRMAAGVAHDFNNILTTIRGFGDLLLRQLPEGDARRGDVDQIRQAADRGVALTSQLLVFGERQAPVSRLLDLHQLLGSMEGLIRRLVGADIQVELKLRPGAAMLRMDPSHLEQMLVNIILNARDAMPKGGVLTIETAERQVSARAKGRRVRAGTYVMIAIRDTGTGMDGETRTHLFEPFHSADAAEQRAGLGLSIVYGIVRQNGGAVRVSSDPGQGTSVKVYLPQAAAETARAEEPELPQGHETILVVEDEDGVRELVRQILTEQGHTVLAARQGRDAILIAERYERPIDLMVTDVVMPEMGGAELVRRMAALRPNMKVLYISGYTGGELLRRGVEGRGTAFLHKPFTADGLARRVQEVLNGETAATT